MSFFFFQAEDGIRDLVRSRGLGDVYKRQPKEIKIRHIGNCLKADPAYGEGVARALGIAMSEIGLWETTNKCR